MSAVPRLKLSAASPFSSSPSSLSALHSALSSRLHRLTSPCQVVASATEPLKKRKAALKELLHCLSDETTQRCLSAADALSARDDGLQEHYSPAASWTAVVDAVMRLTSNCDRDEKTPSSQAWEALRWTVEAAERSGGHHLVSSSVNLLPPLLRVVRSLLSPATDPAKQELCAPAATHVLVCLLSHAPYLQQLSASALSSLFSLYSLAFRAILSSRDQQAYREFVATESSGPLCSPCPPPVSLFRCVSLVGQVLRLILSHWPHDVRPFTQRLVMPLLTSLSSVQARGVQGVELAASSLSPAFSHAAFAELLTAFTASVQRQHGLLLSAIVCQLPGLLSALLQAYPLSNAQTAATMQCKQAAVSLLAFAFALQSRCPHLPLLQSASHQLLPLIARVCLWELRRPTLLTLQWQEVRDADDGDGGCGLDEGTTSFLRLCVGVFHQLELRAQDGAAAQDEHKADRPHQQQRQQQEDDSRQRILSLSSFPRSSSPDTEEADNSRSRKRRKEVHAPSATPELSAASPLPQLLLGFSFSTCPPLSHFLFLFVFASLPASASFLLSTPQRLSDLQDLLQHLTRWARRANSIHTRQWSLHCIAALAAACRLHAAHWQPHHPELQTAWEAVSSVCVKRLLQDENRLIIRQTVALLACLLHQQLLPSALHAALVPVLADLPRLLSPPSSSAAARSASSLKAAVKQELEDDAVDSQSAAAAFLFPTPACDCDAVALRFITACCASRPLTSLLDSQEQAEHQPLLAAAVSSAGANTLRGMLLHWVVRLPSAGGKLPAAEWHSAAVVALLQLPLPAPLAAFLFPPSSWSDVSLPSDSASSSACHPLAAPSPSACLSPPSEPATCLTLRELDCDSAGDLLAFLQTAYLARLLPLPSFPSFAEKPPEQPPEQPPASAAADSLRAAFPHYAQLHAQEAASRMREAEEQEEKADGLQLLHHARGLLHYLRLLLSLPPIPRRPLQLLSSLLSRLASSLSAVALSSVSLPLLDSLLQSLHQLLVPPVSSFAFLSVPPEEMEDEEQDGHQQLVDTLSTLSGTLLSLLCRLLESGDQSATGSPPDEKAAGSSSLADGGASALDVADDFLHSVDDDSTVRDFSAVFAPPLASLPAFPALLRRLHALLLALLKLEVPLPAESYAAMQAMTEAEPASPFVFQLLLLLLLHDSLLHRDNLLLLRATQRLSDAVNAERDAKDAVVARRREEQSRSSRLRRGGSRAQADDNDDSEEQQTADEAADELSPLSLQAVSFCLHLCQFVQDGDVELGQEAASGAEMSEEEIMKGFIASMIDCIFPSSLSQSSCPSSLSPLLRCLCCLRGLDSGLLSSWSLTTSLFPLLASPSLSLSSVVVAAATLAAMMDRTTDAERLWSSSSDRLLQTVEEVRERQRKAAAERNEEAGRRCDELLYAVLGCLAAMSIRRLDWERRVLLLLCRLSADSGDEGQWPMRAVLQQMSQALGYTPATPCPQPFVMAAAAPSPCSPSASPPSLFTRPCLSLLEEHVDYLLMHWLTEPGADLFSFPFALLQPPSPELPVSSRPSFLPIAAPSLSSSLTRYMPQVLSACLLSLSSHEAALLALPSHVNDTLPALLSRHWDALFSYCYALYSSSSPQAAAAAKLAVLFLKQQLRSRAFNALHHSRLPHLLAALLSLLSRQPAHPLLPVYDSDCFTKSVIQLSSTSSAGLASSSSPAEFLCQPGEDRLVLLLLHLRSSLYAEYRQERQWRWLQALRTLLSLLDCFLAKGYVTRLLLDLLLAVLEEADERFGDDKGEQVVDMLAHLLQRVVELGWRGGEEEKTEKGSSSVTDMAAEDIGRHLRLALLQLIRRAADNADRQRRLAAIVTTLTARVPPHHALLQPLMLLSGHPSIGSLSHPPVSALPPSLQSLLASYLLCFDDLTAHCHTSCMIPLTAALLACLQQRRQQLLAWLSSASAAAGTDAKAATVRIGRSETGRRRAVEETEVSVPRFLAVLIRLCSSSSPPALRELAAQCLGEIGLVDPQRIPQRHTALFQPAPIPQPAAAPAASASSALPPAFSPTFARWYQLGEGLGQSPARLVSAMAEPRLHILRHYHQYLLYLLALALRSPSLLLQRLAFCTLTALFNSDTRSEAQQACHSLTAEVQVCLFPFSTRAEASKGSIASVPGSQLVMSLQRELKARPEEQQAVAAVVASLPLSSSGLDAELWRISPKEAGQWLSRVLYQLLRVQVSDGLLRLMKEQALFDAELALRLFPLAVMDCLSSGRTSQQSELAAVMMKAMRDCLECCRGEAELRPFLSPLLLALQYVREQLLILQRQPVPSPPRQPADATAAAAAAGTAAASAPAPAPAAPVAALLPSNQPLKAALLSFLQELDQLLVAEAACALGWHSYALLWLESWRRQQDDVRDAADEAAKDKASGLKRRLSAPSPSLSLSASPSVGLSDASSYHRLLLSAYRQLDEPDGLYGVLHTAPSTLPASLSRDVVLAEHGNDWPTALALHDMAASQAGITRALQQLQCSTLLAAYSRTTEAAVMDEQQTEQAWRAGQWSIPATRVVASAGFNSSLYLALRSLQASGGILTASTSARLSSARQALLQQVESLNSERVTDVFPFLMRQVMLADVASSSSSPLPNLLSCPAEFELVEPLLALRLSLQSLRRAPASALISQLCSSSSLARQAGRPLTTARHIRLAAELLDAVLVTEERELLETRLQVCHAQLNSAGGHVDSAIRELQGCLSRLQRQRQELPAGGGGGGEQQRGGDWLELDVLVNSLLGDWLSSSHSESAQSISAYLTRALSQAQTLAALPASSSSAFSSSVSSACSVGSQHFALGNFHDRQFQSLLQRAQSAEYRERRAHFLGRSSSIAEDRQRLKTPEAEALLARKDVKDERFIDLKKLERLLAQREKEQEMDRRDFDLHDDAFTAHLHSAIAHYQQCLAAAAPPPPQQQQQQDTFALYRFCALWFNHDRYLPLSPAKTANLSRISSIPSHQFIPLVYQLASRLMPVPAKSALSSSGLPTEEYLFRKHVAALLARMCCEHPHQCLTGDHRVLTRCGWQSITRVQVGDEVLSFNIATYAMEWKPVLAVESHAVDRAKAADSLYRMQGSGMDVIATRDHRMLLARLCARTANGLQAGTPVGYETVGELLGATDSATAVRGVAHTRERSVICAGYSAQPGVKVVISGLEQVCDWWWQQDGQLGFLQFLGFWLGDGYLNAWNGVVGIAQKKEAGKQWLEQLLSRVFPRWWYRTALLARPGYVAYGIRCPPLYDYLRLMVVGPLGYNPRDRQQLRSYPHFTKDEGLACTEQQSDYYLANNSRGYGSTWTEAAMLAAFTAAVYAADAKRCWWCRAAHWETGNEMVMCSGCQHSGHLQCAGLAAVPEGDWLCPACSYVVEAGSEGAAEMAATLAAEAMERVEEEDDAAPSPARRSASSSSSQDRHSSVGAATTESSTSQSASAERRFSFSGYSDHGEEKEGKERKEAKEGKESPASLQPMDSDVPALEEEGDDEAQLPLAEAVEDEAVAQGMQAAGRLVWYNDGLCIIIDGRWFYLKRWLGVQNVANVYSRLSRQQAVALLEGFCRADGNWKAVRYDDGGEPTGQWRCSSSSFPLIDDLMLIGQLAGAAVDLHLHTEAGNRHSIAGRGVSLSCDHWALCFMFTKSARGLPFHTAMLAQPVDVSGDMQGRGYYGYEDDGFVFDITVQDNSNFLTQRLSSKRLTSGDIGVRAHSVFVGNCLYPLFALTAGGQVERVAGSFQSASEINSQRIQAASHLLAQLKTQPSVRDIITAQERLIAAYVELGNRKYRKEDRSVALKDTQLDRLSKKELQLLAVPTLTLPVLPSASYPPSSLVSIVRFDSTCQFASSGINRPLVLQLLCSDGQRHRQLLKASDDLRQDAVMEQLFSLVNSLLHADARTRRRQMRMRTYKVVPLTPGVGLVEWVSNTRSLHDCIVHHSDGTHARYHLPPSPAVWPYLQCLAYMRDCNERAELPSRYQLVCSRFPPSLHCHLLEQFPSSSAWFAARLRYTRSLAVASIIGYAVGLGDRHIQNILIDSQTAELVHIDLGVAFDTGRLLKTPELVPFRLTRAMVDGLGVAGVEGGYRRGCEDVLRLLRDNGAMVAVLLEVFVYDPLYKWTLSASKLRQLRPDAAAAAAAGGGGRDGAAAEAAAQQKEQKTTAGTVAALPTQPIESASSPLLSVGELSSAAAAVSAVGSKVNSGAYRALSAVKHRLAGEDGSIGGSSRLSVEGQVAALIQQATSEEKLSQMYWGWSAWV